MLLLEHRVRRAPAPAPAGAYLAQPIVDRLHQDGAAVGTGLRLIEAGHDRLGGTESRIGGVAVLDVKRVLASCEVLAASPVSAATARARAWAGAPVAPGELIEAWKARQPGSNAGSTRYRWDLSHYRCKPPSGMPGAPRRSRRSGATRTASKSGSCFR